MVGSGVAAATTASTVAAAAFIGSAAIYGAAVLASASCSNSIEEFNAQGNWGTVAATAGGAVFSGQRHMQQREHQQQRYIDLLAMQRLKI